MEKYMGGRGMGDQEDDNRRKGRNEDACPVRSQATDGEQLGGSRSESRGSGAGRSGLLLLQHI